MIPTVFPIPSSKLNVDDYFQRLCGGSRSGIGNQGIELVYANYVDKDVLVIADGEQIRRVIHNLISNAIKYMDKSKGIIQIRVKDVGDFIQVEVEDNGKGIASKDLTCIFDRFYRTDVSRNSSKGGSGIGLSIVKKNFRGSRRKGLGYEPCGNGYNYVLCFKKISGGTYEMSKILIIEDEEAIADLEKDYLELSGFEVEIANRGDVGLDKALKEDFDLIILDLMLPEVDGFDICRQVRQQKNTPIIMVSAKKDDIDKIRGLALEQMII